MKKRIINNLKELRIPSELIEDREEINSIIKDLEDTLVECSNGIGLSAVQIGVNKKVGIIRYKDIKINLVNSKIIEKYDKFKMVKEGCLSLPGIFCDTLRYKEVTIENNGKQFVYDITVDNIVCIAIQHELSHFSGRLILDCKWRKK